MTFKAQLQTLAGLTPAQAARVEIAVKLSLAMPPLGDETSRQLAGIGFKEAGKGYTKTVRHAVGNGTHTLEVTPTGRGRYNFTVTAHIAPRSVTAVLKLGIALPDVVTLANKYSDPATVLNLPQVQSVRQAQSGRRVSSQGATRVALYGAPAKALKMRYNRGNLDDTMRVAKAQSAGKVLYVFATAAGFTISKTPPPATQRHYVVRDGKVSEAGGLPGR